MALVPEVSGPEEERVSQIMQQMHCIKDIRSHTLQLEKLKVKVMEEFQEMKMEENRLNDYKQELELLEEERLAHVEELRQIHADMKAMETIIRNAEADRNRSLELAYSVFKEYNSLKSEIDQGRRQLGLEEVPPLVVGEETLDKQYFKKRRTELKNEAKVEISVPDSPTQVTAKEERSPPGDSRSSPSTSAVTRSLRVQMPPMKLCQACQQPIHRNAPVCPLCKAKSKSQNPKKTKRKFEEDY